MSHATRLRLGWALVSAVVLLGIVRLNAGIFVGSSVTRERVPPADQMRYAKRCHYLFPTGVALVLRGYTDTPDEADRLYCRMTGTSN
jgi:hypothetical protein